MNIHEANRGIQKYRKRKRIGRGIGSGVGKTAGRGHKGQRSNPGYAALPIFEGGRMPLVRRIPKRGFHNKFALTVCAVNIGDLEKTFEADTEVTPDSLKETSLAKSCYDVLKILGDGTLSKRLTVSAHRFSRSAREKIEQAGGKVVVLPGKVPVERKKRAKARAAV